MGYLPPYYLTPVFFSVDSLGSVKALALVGQDIHVTCG